MADHDREVAAYVNGSYEDYLGELRWLPVPTPVDEALRTMLMSNDTNYDELHNLVSERGAVVLRVFAERAASWGVLQGAPEVLTVGLFAASLVLDNPSTDRRETFLFLPCYRRAFERLGLDPVVAGHDAVPTQASATTRRTIEGYLKPTGASLEDMGFVEIEPDERGSVFVRLPYDQMIEQTRRLAKEKVARLVEARENQER